MFLLALVATPMAAGQSAVPDLQEEITVIGMKFRTMKFKADFRTEDGVIVVKKCRVTRSSKDKEIDALGCAVTRACAATTPMTPKELGTCIETRGEEAIANLAKLRVAARRSK